MQSKYDILLGDVSQIIRVPFEKENDLLLKIVITRWCVRAKVIHV